MVNNKILYDPNSTKSDYFGFTFDVETIIAEDAQIKAIEVQITEHLSSFILEKIKTDVPQLISYTDFFGEAENFLAANNLPWAYRKEIAKQLYTNFLHYLPDSISYNKEKNCIEIHEKYIAFESGDYYSPAYSIITGHIKQWVQEINKTNK